MSRNQKVREQLICLCCNLALFAAPFLLGVAFAYVVFDKIEDPERPHKLFIAAIIIAGFMLVNVLTAIFLTLWNKKRKVKYKR